MERIKRWLPLVVALLSGVGAWGQTVQKASVAGRAQVVAVAPAGAKDDFQVPQVRLRNAAVARRINSALVGQFLTRNLYDTTQALSAAQAIRQAKQQYKANNQAGLAGAGFTVLLNQQGLLSLAFFYEYMGAYSSTTTSHATFDLRTGRLLSLSSLLLDPPAQLTARMRGAISRRFAEALAGAAKTEDATTMATVATLTDLLHWDQAARQVKFAGVGATQEGAAPPDLDNFALTPTALLLFYSPEFPHVIEAMEPDNTYRFPYAWLHPGPRLKVLLAQPVKTASATKK